MRAQDFHGGPMGTLVPIHGHTRRFGAWEHFAYVPSATGHSAVELRRPTPQPGKGAQDTAVVTVTSSGSLLFDDDDDDDDEPQWHIDVVPDSYVEDPEVFPRDEEHRLAWLRQKLDLAGAEQPESARTATVEAE